jgi:hypothetical protein
VLLFALIVVLCIAYQTADAAKATKNKGTVAVPRKVKGNPLARSIFGSVINRAVRELKGNFCSELEGLTLQVQSVWFVDSANNFTYLQPVNPI